MGDINFLRTLGVIVVGLWRKEGWIGDEVAQVPLREGDLLVLWGRDQTFAELAAHRGFLMMVPFAARQRQRHRAPVAIAIVAAVIVAAATGLLPVQLAFLAGAVAMVLSRCLSVEQAYRGIDTRIYVMIAGVIPLGAAMEQTGTAELLARQLLRIAEGWSPLGVLLLSFGAASLLTQVLSDAATVVLLGPVAISLAAALGLPPEPLLVCTALGAVASFLVPIGHHGNLLILNPGTVHVRRLRAGGRAADDDDRTDECVDGAGAVAGWPAHTGPAAVAGARGAVSRPGFSTVTRTSCRRASASVSGRRWVGPHGFGRRAQWPVEPRRVAARLPATTPRGTLEEAWQRRSTTD